MSPFESYFIRNEPSLTLNSFGVSLLNPKDTHLPERALLPQMAPKYSKWSPVERNWRTSQTDSSSCVRAQISGEFVLCLSHSDIIAHPFPFVTNDGE